MKLQFQLSNSAPFHRLLARHKFLPTRAGRWACTKVKWRLLSTQRRH